MGGNSSSHLSFEDDVDRGVTFVKGIRVCADTQIYIQV